MDLSPKKHFQKWCLQFTPHVWIETLMIWEQTEDEESLFTRHPQMRDGARQIKWVTDRFNEQHVDHFQRIAPWMCVGHETPVLIQNLFYSILKDFFVMVIWYCWRPWTGLTVRPEARSHFYWASNTSGMGAGGRGGREKARARRFKERARFAAFALILLRKTVHVEVHPILPICHVSTKSFSCLIVLGIYICICMMNSVL